MTPFCLYLSGAVGGEGKDLTKVSLWLSRTKSFAKAFINVNTSQLPKPCIPSVPSADQKLSEISGSKKLPEFFPTGMGDGQTVAVLMYWSKAHEFLCTYASSPWRSVWGVNQVLASARKCILEYKQEFWNLFFFFLWIWAVAWVWGKSTDAVTGFYFRVPGCLDMSFPFSQCLFRIISVSSRGSAYCMLDIFLYATFIQSQPSFQSVFPGQLGTTAVH